MTWCVGSALHISPRPAHFPDEQGPSLSAMAGVWGLEWVQAKGQS